MRASIVLAFCSDRVGAVEGSPALTDLEGPFTKPPCRHLTAIPVAKSKVTPSRALSERLDMDGILLADVMSMNQKSRTIWFQVTGLQNYCCCCCYSHHQTANSSNCSLPFLIVITLFSILIADTMSSIHLTEPPTQGKVSIKTTFGDIGESFKSYAVNNTLSDNSKDIEVQTEIRIFIFTLFTVFYNSHFASRLSVSQQPSTRILHVSF